MIGMQHVVAERCLSLDEFLATVGNNGQARVRLAASSMAGAQRATEVGEPEPVVRIALTAAVLGSPPRWVTFTTDLPCVEPARAQQVAREYAGTLIARGLRPESGRWSIEDVFGLSGSCDTVPTPR